MESAWNNPLHGLAHWPMNLLKATGNFDAAKVALTLTLSLGLTACSSTDANVNRPRKYDDVAAKAWIEQRANELAASGLKPGEATLKATQEWNHRSMDGSETEGLDQLQKGK